MSGPGPQLVTADGAPASTAAPGGPPAEELVSEVTITMRYNLETKLFSLGVDPPEVIQHRDILYAALDLARERITMMAVRDFLISQQKKVITPDDFFRTGHRR